MTLVSIFCFLVAIGILFTCLRRGADIFSPGRVFAFVWAVAIGLTDLKFSRLQHVWDAYAWITLLLGVVSFLLGILIVHVIYIDQKFHSIQDIRDIMRNPKLRSNILFNIILLLFCCYGIVYIIEWMNYGALPLFASFPDRARNEIPISVLHLLIGTMPIILFLIVEYLLFVPTRGSRKILLISMFMAILLSYFFFLNRLYYVLFFIMVLGFLYYTSRFVRLKNIIIVLAILILFLSALQYFRETRYAENFLYVVSGMKYSPTFAIFTGPYMYIVMNLENFARAVVRLENFTLGYFSFDFLMALTGLKHWIANYFNLEERVFLVSGYNTFPFFWDYYYDFGLIGLTVLSALLGFTIALLHQWVRRQPTLLSVSLYALAFFVIVISFFTNPLTSLNFVFNLIVLIMSQILISRQTISKRRTPELPVRKGI